MLLGCLTFWAGDVTGTTVSGRLTASAYTWQVRELDGTIWRHLRFYQSVALNIRGLGVEPLSFHSYIQASADLGDEAPGRRHYRIYHAYLRWRPQGKLGMDLSAGRQRVYGAGWDCPRPRGRRVRCN